MPSKNMAEYMAKRRIARRMKLIEMSGGKCVVCACEDNLEFNHIDRTQKLFGLDLRGMDKPWSLILEEWSKCELLCHTHHLEKTKEQYNNGEIIQPNSLKHLPYVHGTMRMYQEKSCRCNLCKYAKREYRKGGVVYSKA